MNTGTSWQTLAPAYTTVEMLLDDVSKQMASQNLSRYSRNSASQKSNSMRIVKPNSASNSPRNSMGLGRRRTVMNDGAYRRRLAMIDQNTAAVEFVPLDGLQAPTRTGRPVSWHPSSHLVPQQMYQQTYQNHTPDMNAQYQFFDFPPTPVAYSGYTSPVSAFSPLSMPYNGYEQSTYQESHTSYPTDQSYMVNHQFITEQPAQNIIHQQLTNNQEDPSMYSHFDWNNFAANGFENSTTAPPTPENFLPIQHPEPSLSAEESIPYHSLSEDDDGEEVLVGMGLYDSPEPAKVPSSDPQLANYRAFMMSSLFNNGARRVEPTGKGLKLEETWNPPPTDDEDEDDEEQDGEGEDDEEEPPEDVTEVTPSSIKVEQSMSSVTYPSTGMQSGLAYDRSGWL